MNRRTALRASGVSVALPMLEAMVRPAAHANARTDASDPAGRPNRLVTICTTLGLHAPFLWPEFGGKNYEVTPYLAPLADHRNDFTLFSGLAHEDQIGRQPHDSELTFLTSARRPGMEGFRNTISIDQLAAAKLGTSTRFPSITLSTLKPKSQSFTSSGVMIPARTSPSSLFASLFLDGTAEEIAIEKRRLASGHSVLDRLADEAKSLKRRASISDSHLLDDYFESIRSAEEEILQQNAWVDQPKPKVSIAAPEDILDPADLIGKTKLLISLIPLILRTDSSRVVSLMIQDHIAVPKVPGVVGSHHALSHHGQNAAKIEQLQRVETSIIESFAGLLDSIKATQEMGRPLLESTSILFGSNLGNANAHDARNLPILLAGGDYPHGSFVQSETAKPLCNLFLTMLQKLGIEASRFGQSTGTLTW